MRFNRCVAAIVIISTMTALEAAQTSVDSFMDWGTGVFRISASRPLDPGISPWDHPRALKAMERELTPIIVSELEGLAWNRQGTLADLVGREPGLKTAVEKVALSLERLWSRLSLDRKSVEAEYSLVLTEALNTHFPPEEEGVRAPRPLGWTPVPEDPWSGIVIYVPSGLPVRGTGLTADLVPALRARILSHDLKVLADPSNDGSRSLAYRRLDDRAAFESLVGRRPYRTMARALYGESPCDIILGEDDSHRILASESGRRALREGRIAILLAP